MPYSYPEKRIIFTKYVLLTIPNNIFISLSYEYQQGCKYIGLLTNNIKTIKNQKPRNNFLHTTSVKEVNT